MIRYTAIFLALLFFSCSSKNDVSKTNEELNAILLIDKDLDTPIFKDSLASNYVKEYNSYISNYIKALIDEDDSQIEDLRNQNIELVEKAKLVSKNIETEAEIEKFKKWIVIQQKKIELLNNNK